MRGVLAEMQSEGKLGQMALGSGHGSSGDSARPKSAGELHAKH